MSRVVSSVLAAVAILGAVVTAYVVLAPDPDDDPFRGSVFVASVESTPRGLAMAVIDHLGGRTVTSVAATGRGGLAVAITTDDPAVASVTVFVGQSTDGPATCGTDSGYLPVSCSTDGPVLEVVRRAPGGAAPTSIGRVSDELRGGLLIEVHGDSDAPAVLDLVQALVEDDELGTYTTEDRNARGRDLDVVPLVSASRLEVVHQRH